MNPIRGGGEPDIVGLVGIGALSEPGQVQFVVEGLEDRGRRGLETCSNVDWRRIPVPSTIGALIPNSVVRSLGFPRNVQTSFETGEGRRMITLRTNPVVGREIVFKVGVRVGIIGRTSAEENAVAGRTVREPQLSVPDVRWRAKIGNTRKPRQGQLESLSWYHSGS